MDCHINNVASAFLEIKENCKNYWKTMVGELEDIQKAAPTDMKTLDSMLAERYETTTKKCRH